MKKEKQLTAITPKYITIDDSAKYLGISKRKLRYLKDDGLVTFYRLGKRSIVLKISDLDNLVEQGKEI